MDAQQIKVARRNRLITAGLGPVVLIVGLVVAPHVGIRGAASIGLFFGLVIVAFVIIFRAMRCPACGTINHYSLKRCRNQGCKVEF